jgi:anti-sigma factor ChrR (cupin superfamily)
MPDTMQSDCQLDWAAPYALGALDAHEHALFEAHLQAGCDACAAALASEEAVLVELAASLPTETPAPLTRVQLLDLAEAPRELPALDTLSWEEVVPGIRLHLVKEDPGRGLRACLAWATPGARNALHRHKGGDELILVLQGGLRDERGEYHAGDLCRSRPESVHFEEILPGEDCIAYVLYYGELVPVDA